MKVAVMFYHKNIQSIYKERWINKCIESISNQTYTKFDVAELNYAKDAIEPLARMDGKTHIHLHKELDNHTHAMNYMLDYLFNSRGYDVVFNTNMDDYYHPERFQKQIDVINKGYDLVSSDFCYIEENGEIDEVTRHMKICSFGDIEMNIRKKHNVIAHPCVAYNKTFWNDSLKYNDLLGWEDLDLWMRGLDQGKKFHIIDEELLYYRIHNEQVTKKHKLGI